MINRGEDRAFLGRFWGDLGRTQGEDIDRHHHGPESRCTRLLGPWWHGSVASGQGRIHGSGLGDKIQCSLIFRYERYLR